MGIGGVLPGFFIGKQGEIYFTHTGKVVWNKPLPGTQDDLLISKQCCFPESLDSGQVQHFISKN